MSKASGLNKLFLGRVPTKFAGPYFMTVQQFTLASGLLLAIGHGNHVLKLKTDTKFYKKRYAPAK